MSKISELLQELGISKVKLAKYLGVSRQMVYNYLELDSVNKWPKEKKILLFKLLDINDGDDKTINNIKITTDYLMEVENRLTSGVKSTPGFDNYFNLNDLKAEQQNLVTSITYLIKELLLDDDENNTTFYVMKYMYNMLQSLDNVPEIKYIFGYMAKTTGFVDPEEYKFDGDKQFIFEGILYSALTLYNNGGASKTKLAESHKRFVQEINQKKEETLSRTQQLNTIKIQALRELGYNEINAENASEVLEKIAEIESRKV